MTHVVAISHQAKGGRPAGGGRVGAAGGAQNYRNNEIALER